MMQLDVQVKNEKKTILRPIGMESALSFRDKGLWHDVRGRKEGCLPRSSKIIWSERFCMKKTTKGEHLGAGWSRCNPVFAARRILGIESGGVVMIIHFHLDGRSL